MNTSKTRTTLRDKYVVLGVANLMGRTTRVGKVQEVYEKLKNSLDGFGSDDSCDTLRSRLRYREKSPHD